MPTGIGKLQGLIMTSEQIREQDLQNQKALAFPQIGDYWHEMFCPYFVIVNKEGDKFRVLSCLGGPDSFTRKDELNARIEVDSGHWGFDYSKSMLVDHEWIRRTVTYESIDGFVADVVQSEKTDRIAQEWRNWKQTEMRKQIQALESEWEKFTGWKYLKESTEV